MDTIYIISWPNSESNLFTNKTRYFKATKRAPDGSWYVITHTGMKVFLGTSLIEDCKRNGEVKLVGTNYALCEKSTFDWKALTFKMQKHTVK